MANEKPLTKASDFDPEVLSLFDKYVHGIIDRRGFLDGAAKFAVGGVTAAGLLQALSPNFARAQQVPPTDPRIKVEWVEFASPAGYGKGRGYLARPANASGPLPVVLVCHENRGLNPHIEDIARRLALADFIAFAPDELFSQGGYPGDEEKAVALFGKLEQAKAVEDFVAAAEATKAFPGTNGKLGVVGFCWGGGMVNTLATRLPDLVAAVPFYGPAPALDQVPKIKAKLLAVFADKDDRVNGSWVGYEAALKAAGVSYEAYKYPGTVHGFNNDTTPRYDEASAKQAWARTIDLFNRTLRG
ncbi:MAG: Carboxymethylenebutenolidase [Rhizobacter sp.]|nr:Carboxymethylenebutenolidase [Rhizobacter sp.]